MTLRPGTYGVVSHSQGFVSESIRLLTRSRYSHAFVVVDNGLVVEAQPQGAILAPLAKYTSRPPHQIAYNDEEPLTDAQRAGIVQHARALVGTPYGYLDIAALGLMSLGITNRWLTQRAQSEHRLICSQLVSRAYFLGAGIDLGNGRPDATVTPGDLADRITQRCWELAA